MNYNTLLIAAVFVAACIINQTLKKGLRKIMATQDDIIAQQKAQAEKIAKIGNETRELIDKVQTLLDQINAGEVKQELKDAADAVDAQLKIVDDLVPDAP